MVGLHLALMEPEHHQFQWVQLSSWGSCCFFKECIEYFMLFFFFFGFAYVAWRCGFIGVSYKLNLKNTLSIFAKIHSWIYLPFPPLLWMVVLMFLLTFMMQSGRISAKQREEIMVWPSVEAEQISKRKAVDNQREFILFSSHIFLRVFCGSWNFWPGLDSVSSTSDCM